MSLTETIPGSRLPASRVVLFEEETLDAFVPEFKGPCCVRFRPDADQKLLELAQSTGLSRNHLKKLAYSAFLERVEQADGFHILPKAQ